MRGLVLEITEEERVLDVERLQRLLDPLRARGARIAVDDAGEGYAGLRQVMSMRADIIKLDRSLVADVHADPAKVALIGSLVHFARSTGAAICAEGVETLEELRVLIHLGVAYGQGWALARPGAGWPRVQRRGGAALPRAALGAHQDRPAGTPAASCGGGPSGAEHARPCSRGSGRCSSAPRACATTPSSTRCSRTWRARSATCSATAPS